MSWTAASGFRALLRSEERDVFEPAGQDGRCCQYLAVADQLKRKGWGSSALCDSESLELAMLDWLAMHRDDVTIGWTRGDMGQVDLLSDAWTAAEFTGVMARTAWGDHFTLAALCGVLHERHGIRARVWGCMSQSQACVCGGLRQCGHRPRICG